jgi:hypothetical protein
VKAVVDRVDVIDAFVDEATTTPDPGSWPPFVAAGRPEP